MRKFELIEHTADVGIRAYGSDLRELFQNAAIGLFSFILQRDEIGDSRTVTINLEEENQEELLVAWLNELLFYLSVREFIPQEFVIGNIDEKSISAQLKGETFDPQKHAILSEIKAATYHELTIDKTEQGYEAKVIFDT